MMKFYSSLMTLLILILTSTLFSQDITWGSDQKIVTGGGGTGIRPRILALDAEHGIMIWGNTSAQSIQYALWKNDTLSQTYNINMKNTLAFITDWASTEIAGRNQFVYIVYKENPADLGKIYLLRSMDYGKTFSTQIIVADDNGYISRFPGVVIDKNNQPIVSYMRFKTDWTQARYVTLRSSDFGDTFSPYLEATDISKGTACDCCPVGMAADGDRIAVLYRNNRNNFRNMTAAVSLDNAATYSYTQELDTTNWFLQSCPASGGDGFFNDQYLHTTWMSGRTGIHKVFYSRLNLNTQKVDAFQIMNHNQARNLQQEDPKMAGNKDTIGMCWTELSNGLDVFFSYFVGNNSADLPKNTVRINIDRNSNQDTPDLTFINGKFYLCWHDANDNTIRFKKGIFNTVTAQKDLKDHSEVNLLVSKDGVRFYSEKNIESWSISNINGQEVARGQNDFNTNVNLTNHGVYFLSYRMLGRQHVSKFIF